MKKVIPEQVTHYCDSCKNEIDGKTIDCSGNVVFYGRDYRGCVVGSNTVAFELCPNCTNKLKGLLEGETE